MTIFRLIILFLFFVLVVVWFGAFWFQLGYQRGVLNTQEKQSQMMLGEQYYTPLR